MTRLLICAVTLVVMMAAPALAVIKVLTPLSHVLDDMPSIFVAEVDKVEPDKPGVVFKFTEDLKGKAPAERFAMNLTGDNFSKKDGHTKVMLDRLAPGRKLILFTKPTDGTYLTFGYLEGTWFQIQGTTDPDTKAIRWTFLHCEPFFRRTYKGTTAELRAVIVDAIAGKKAPPPVDEKEPNGYGPVVEKKEPPKKEPESPTATSLPFASATFNLDPIFGVIPSSILLGPLAILAAVFPSTFAGVAAGMTRWRALLIIVSINSLIATAFYFLEDHLPDAWWCGGKAVAGLLLAITAFGVVWAGRRYRVAASDDPTVTDTPVRNEWLGLLGITVGVGLMLLGIGWWFGTEQLTENPGREFTASFVGLCAATLYSGYRILTQGLDADTPEAPVRLSAPGEAVALAAMLLFGAVVLTTKFAPVATVGPPGMTDTSGQATTAPSVTAPKLIDFELWYESNTMSQTMSSACVTDQYVYLGGLRRSAFSMEGILVCLERATGKEKWSFTSSKIPADWKKENPNDFRTVFSTPTVVDGKLYVGEGLHEDSDCRLFCLDAVTGAPLWRSETRSHTEGTAIVSEGKVYFSAGDDGLMCVASDTGKTLWKYPETAGSLHIDTPAILSKGRIYAGSGYNTFAVFALDAKSGKEIWKKDLPLRSFGTPLVLGSEVYFGLGTGNLVLDLSTEVEKDREPEKTPAGLVISFDAATGKENWRLALPRSVHTQMAGDDRHIYAACRDGWLYAIDRVTGKQVWRASSGQPIISGVVAATDPSGRFPVGVYLAGPTGQVTCHDPLTGAAYWSRSVQELVGRETTIQGTPTLVTLGETNREVFVPVTLKNRNNTQTRAGLVRFTDTDPLFPLLVKQLQRYEKSGFLRQ